MELINGNYSPIVRFWRAYNTSLLRYLDVFQGIMGPGFGKWREYAGKNTQPVADTGEAILRSWSVLTAKRRGEQAAKSAWAKKIVLPEGTPEAYREYFEPYLLHRQSLPYTVLIPGFEVLGHKISEKILCAIDREIHILERDWSTFTALCYPIDGVRYVEVRTVLLDSYIKISGVTGQGAIASSTLQYNQDSLRSEVDQLVERFKEVTPIH